MKIMLVYARFLLLIVLMGLFFVACSEVNDDPSDKILNDHIPMVYVSDALYGDSGKIVSTIPDGVLYVGKIMQVVPQNKAMIQVNFTANVQVMDCDIYKIDNESNTIYIELSSGNKEQYSVYTRLE